MAPIPSVPPPEPFRSRPPVASPRHALRLLVAFGVTLGVVLLLVGAAVAAVAPPAPQAVCPDPTKPCGPPPNAPTLPPFTVGASSAPTSAPSLPRPSGVAPSAAVNAAPSASPSAAAVPSAPASSASGAIPSTNQPALGTLPQPVPASSEAPATVGTVWTSKDIGYSFQYDADLWTVQQQDGRGVLLTAANGNVAVVITGALARDVSADQALSGEANRLSQNILGFTEQADPSLLLPGSPHIGYQAGVGNQYVGTLNSPQGPTVAVDAVIIAATDQRITLLVSVTTVDRLRTPSYQAVDSILNTVDWGSGQ